MTPHLPSVLLRATLVALFACVFVAPVLAQECPDFVSRMPSGSIGGVAVSGDYAYLGIGTGLQIVDVSDPFGPVMVGFIEIEGGANQVVVDGDHAYALGSRVLSVLDLSTPAAPVVVGSTDAALNSGSLEVSAGYAYMAGGSPWESGYLQVIDVRNPIALTEVSFYELDSCPAHCRPGGLAVSEGYAYLTTEKPLDNESDFRVIDVRNPSDPVELGLLDMSGYSPSGVDVSGNHAYVVASGFEVQWVHFLQVIDVSNPNSPKRRGRTDTDEWPEDIAVAGSYAYVTGSIGLSVIDVQDPFVPSEVGSLPMTGRAQEVQVSGNQAYVTWNGTGENGLAVAEVSAPAEPMLVGSVGMVTWIHDVAALDDHAYLVSMAGLHVVDASAPSAPAEVGFVDTSNLDARLVAASGAHAYVVGGWCNYGCRSNLSVIDVTTPSAPVEIGGVEFDGLLAHDVAVSGDFAYIANEVVSATGRLQVIDVSIRTAPAEVGFIDIPAPAYGVAVAGSYVYVASAWEGLRVIDVSTPSAPVEVGSVGTPGVAHGVAARGRYAYVVGGGSGFSGFLQVVDASTPSAPTSIVSIVTPDTAYEVALSGGFVHIASEDWPYGHPHVEVGGLRVFSIFWPWSPVEIGFFDMPVRGADSLGVAASGNTAFFANIVAGSRIFDVSGCSQLVPSLPAPRRPGRRVAP